MYGRLGWRFLHHESVDARGGPADHTVDTAPLAVDLCISFSNAHAECVDYKLYSRASIRHDHVGRKFDFLRGLPLIFTIRSRFGFELCKLRSIRHIARPPTPTTPSLAPPGAPGASALRPAASEHD